MSQLTFKFPFAKKYYEQDFFVATNNFSAFKLIESWPNWPGKWLNIFGDSGSGKTHLSKILEKKINKIKLINAEDINNNIIQDLNNIECLIIDNFNKNIEEKLFYSILNQSKQTNVYTLINSEKSVNKFEIKLEDLKSRLKSFSKILCECLRSFN